MSGEAKNVLLITVDDLGIERDDAYAPLETPVIPSTEYVRTPVARSLYQRGVMFRKARAYAICSAHRGARETGKWAFQTGMGRLVDLQGYQPLLLSEVCLPRAFKLGLDGAIDTAMFGKFHLGTDATQYPLTPLLMGYDEWAGTEKNLEFDYYQWFRDTKAGREMRHDYVEFNVTDDAIAWCQGREMAGRRWFCSVNYHLVHFPYHRPPAGTYDASSYVLPRYAPLGAEDWRPYLKAMIQTVDFETGRLLKALGDGTLSNTLVVWCSDNGTPSNMLPDQFIVGAPGSVYPPGTPDHGKGAMYDMGLRTQLVMAGPGVVGGGRTINDIWSPVDFMPTLAEALGADLTKAPPPAGTTRRGISAWPSVRAVGTPSARTVGLAEQFTPGGPNLNAATVGTRGVYNAGYKLLRKSPGVAFPDALDEFYDLTIDPYEVTNLVPGGVTGGLTGAQLTGYNALKNWFINEVSTL